MRKKNKVLEVIALDIWKESSTSDDNKFTQHQQNVYSNTSPGKAVHLVPIGMSAPWLINTIMMSIKRNPSFYRNSCFVIFRVILHRVRLIIAKNKMSIAMLVIFIDNSATRQNYLLTWTLLFCLSISKIIMATRRVVLIRE